MLEADGEFHTVLLIEDDKVATMYVVRSPDKLKHLQERQLPPETKNPSNGWGRDGSGGGI